MKEEVRLDYLKRLFSPYRKGNHVDCFLFQYLQGSGNELKEKFWSSKSSSRLCFDLYSWMGYDPSYKAIEFEKKMPGIKSGGRLIAPNMDVYFETTEGLFFIESKYTETVNNAIYKKGLPQAYWETSDVYKSVSGKDVNYPIVRRYHDEEIIKKEFVSFINEIEVLVSNETEQSWFDAKQETCHLLGIVFYVLKNKPNKQIHFLNVAANYSDDDFAEQFRNKAEIMVNRILSKYSISSSFDYKLYSVKDYFEKQHYFEKKGYKSQKTVHELITDRTLYRVPVF